jgi:8-oxo-dGTP pyrophosphatase MutT (NUDIX family)
MSDRDDRRHGGNGRPGGDGGLRRWRYLGRRELASTRVFRLIEERAVSPRTGRERDFVHLATGDWVNVVPLTAAGEVVLVRQWRHGIKDFTLEIPGGIVEDGEDPAAAAAREVREETGHAGAPPQLLGTVEPNPAILDNRTLTYLLEDCRPVGDLQPDAGEDLAVEIVPLGEIPGLIGRGTIRHALVICGFWWLAQRRPDLLTP